MNLKLVLVTISLLFFNAECHSQNTQLYNFSKVDQVVENAISDSAFPGAVLLVYKNGIIIHHKAYGKQTYENNSQAITINTIFDLASLTKVIATTTAAMICYERNLFSVDDPVSKYIPEFAANGKENVTIKNLLLHNSGMPVWKKYYSANNKPEDILQDIYKSKLQFQPGTKTLYSDPGMITLAKVIEKASGKPFDIFCDEEIFKPLKMKNTFFNPDDSLKHRITPTEKDNYWRKKLVHGKVHDENAAMLNGVAGHAGLFSTAEDISRLIRLYLENGESDGKKYFNTASLKFFTKKHTDRALGWDIKSPKGSSAGTLFGERSFGHTGFTGTSVWIDPDKNLFVVFLTNRVYPSRENKKIIRIRPTLHNEIIRTIK